jgi:preprotein translocase subunit SecA
MHERILDMIRSEVASVVDSLIPANHIEDEEQLEQIFKTLEVWFPIPGEVVPENLNSIRRDQLIRDLQDVATAHYQQRGSELKQQVQEQGGDAKLDPQRDLERTYLLQIIDRLWMDHIDALDVMRAGIGLRSVGQRDPLVEFKNEAYRMFGQLKSAIQRNVVDMLMRMLRNEPKIQIQRNEPPKPVQNLHNLRTNEDIIAKTSGQAKNEATANEQRRNGKQQGSPRSPRPANSPRPTTQSNLKIGRNDPCPCGSGKKYKKCHGAS